MMYLPYDLLIAFSIFAFVSSITPGPNNVMLLSSGVNFGFKYTIPHMLGVTIGFAIMVVLVGVGLGEAFHLYPILYKILRYVGAAYLIYLAIKIASAGPNKMDVALAKPLTFLRAALFQWVNPKAWAMAAVAVTNYVPEGHHLENLIIIALLYCVFVLPCCMLWTAFGSAMRRYLSSPTHLHIFNWTMAVLLILSLYPMFHE